MTDSPVNADQAPADDPAGAGLPPDEGWQTAKNGRQFVPNPGGGWPVWRKGQESVQDALTRAAQAPADSPPRSRAKRQGKPSGGKSKAPPRARDETTRAIQEMCAGVLTAPAIGCAMIGDEWGANHFQVQGERFAANLARSSEHNPWLRSKLEKGLEGETTIMAILTSVSLTAGAVGYVAPPLIKYAGLPVPDRARVMLGVPFPPAHHAMPPAAPEPAEQLAGEPGSVPITDALSDPEQLAELAQAFQGMALAGAESDAMIGADADDPNTRIQEPS